MVCRLVQDLAIQVKILAGEKIFIIFISSFGLESVLLFQSNMPIKKSYRFNIDISFQHWAKLSMLKFEIELKHQFVNLKAHFPSYQG